MFNYAYKHLCICVCVCIYILICICIHACMHAYLHTYICMYTHIHMYVYTHVCIYIYIYILIHCNTHTCEGACVCRHKFGSQNRACFRVSESCMFANSYMPILQSRPHACGLFFNITLMSSLTSGKRSVLTCVCGYDYQYLYQHLVWR